MLKRPLIVILLASVLLVTMACNISVPAVSVNSGTRGSGKVVEETRDVSGFDRVELEGSGNLYIEQDDKESLRIEAEDNIIPLMDIRVSGDRLVIGFKPNTSINPTRPMNFYLTVKNLSDVTLAGSGNAELKSVKTDQMGLTISGSGDIQASQLDAQTLKVHVFGSGNIKADGSVKELSVELNGSGNFSGLDLQSASASIATAGSGNADVSVSDSLNVSIAGSGSVHYRGDPKINRQSVTGSGSISQVK